MQNLSEIEKLRAEVESLQIDSRKTDDYIRENNPQGDHLQRLLTKKQEKEHSIVNAQKKVTDFFDGNDIQLSAYKKFHLDMLTQIGDVKSFSGKLANYTADYEQKIDTLRKQWAQYNGKDLPDFSQGAAYKEFVVFFLMIAQNPSVYQPSESKLADVKKLEQTGRQLFAYRKQLANYSLITERGKGEEVEKAARAIEEVTEKFEKLKQHLVADINRFKETDSYKFWLYLHLRTCLSFISLTFTDGFAKPSSADTARFVATETYWKWKNLPESEEFFVPINTYYLSDYDNVFNSLLSKCS